MTSATEVRQVTGQDILGSYADDMIAFMTGTLQVPKFEAELAVAQLWHRWTQAYCDRHASKDTREASKGLTEALLYLEGESGTSPGPVADRGWHVMLEHDTRCYAALCDAMLGHYRHHVPNDVVGVEKRGKCNDTNDGGGSSKCVCS